MTLFTVTNTNDSGAGSLRDAIIQANLSQGIDRIIFGGSVFTDATPDLITLTTGELKITDDLVVEGAGAKILTISGNNASRIFQVSDGNVSNQLTIELQGLTITDGYSSNGGSILNDEALTIRNSVIRDNVAEFSGGGVFNNGSLTVIGSTISNNTAKRTHGGGIISGNKLTLINSTVSGNIAEHSGGGLSIETPSGGDSILTVLNSTLTQNIAQNGGGIFTTPGSTNTVQNSIIAANSHSTGGNSPDVLGNFQDSYSTEISNTLGNFRDSDFPGIFKSLPYSISKPFFQVDPVAYLGGSSFNLIGNSVGSTGFTNGIAGNLVGDSTASIDPKLGVLQNNGGSTPTHALLSDSPAINAGDNARIPTEITTDQRGVERIVNGTVDIGAYERINADSASTLKVNAQDFKAGITAGLGKISSLLSSDLAGVSLPILGSLGDRYVPNFLKTLDSLLVNGMNVPEMLLDDFTSRLQNNLPGVKVTVDQSLQQLEITLHKTEHYLDSVPLDSTLGIPLLNLSTAGQASANLSGDMKLTFGFNQDYGFYINTNPTKTHFGADLNAKLSQDFSAKGTLGFIQLDLANRSNSSTGVNGKFDVFLNDLDNTANSGNDGDRLTLTELSQSGYTVRDLFNSSFEISPQLGMKGKTSFLGKDGLPSLNLDLDLKWDAFKYSNGQVTKGQPSLEFNHLQLDMGSFVSNFAKPIFTQVNRVIAPFRPIVNVLNADTKIFTKLKVSGFDENQDGKVSLFEVGSKLNQFAGGNKFDSRFLDAITALDEAGQALNKIGNTAGNITIDLGSHSLGRVNTDASQVTLQQQPITVTKGGSTAQVSENAAVSNFFNALDKVQGLGFPLLKDPTQAVNLLLGKQADLFRYDMPDLDINFGINKSFPIFWPLEGSFSGSFTAKSNLEFGYDTYGLSQLQKTGYSLAGAETLLDGLYVVDQPGNELDLSARVAAGFGLNVIVAAGRIEGGIEGTAGIDLIDVGEGTPNPNWQSEYQRTSQLLQQNYQKNQQANAAKVKGGTNQLGLKNGLNSLKPITDAKIRQDLTQRGIFQYSDLSDGKLRTSEITSRLSKPQDLFGISGAVRVFLDGYASLGVWPLKKEWRKELASFELINFKTGSSTRSGTTSNKYISGSTIFLDANFNSMLDLDEPSTYSSFDGSYTLNFELEQFDKNSNGQIDADEGQWVSLGGFDTFTKQDMETPLVAPGGYSMITPITTLISAVEQQGITSEQAELKVKQALGLSDGIQLSTFDPIAAMKQGNPNGKKVMTAHVGINTLIDQATSLMQGAFAFSPAQISSIVEATMVEQITAGKPLDLTNPHQVENMIKSTSVVLQSLEPSQKWQKVLNIADQAAQVMASSAEVMADSLKKPGSALQTLEQVSKLQAFLVSATSQDLQLAASGKKSIAKVLKENTGKGLEAALKQQADQEQAQQDALKLGTRRSDTLKGGKYAEVLMGQQGNDRLYGEGGRDLLAGEQGQDQLEGGQGNDTVNGGSGKDRLLGNHGNDLLIGEQGADILTGGKGQDRFRLNLEQKGVDQILDFSVRQDRIEVTIPNPVAGLTSDSPIGADQFRIGSRALSSSDRFIYHRQTGALFFDVDGNGAIGQTQIAKLSSGLPMTANAIYVTG